MAGNQHDIWVFGYGSLMWRPDFAFTERVTARIEGYHRCFCIRSTHHRGTPQRPGLVLGLDQGGTCSGVAYRIASIDAPRTIDYLRARELIYGVYREITVRAVLDGSDRRHVTVIAYTAERRHPNYAGHMSLSEQALQIRGARGISGSNLDYLVNTVRQLSRLGIRERELERLAAVAGPLSRRGHPDALARASASAMYVAWRRSAKTEPVTLSDQRRFSYRQRLSPLESQK